MKFSICTTWFKKKKIEEAIQIAVKYGFDGIDIWSGHIDEYVGRGNEINSLKEILKKENLSVPCILPYMDFVGSKEVFEKSIEEAKKCVEYAKALESPLIRVFTGYKIPSSQLTEAQWDMCIDGLKQICEIDKDIWFGVEMHDKQPADRLETIIKMLEGADKENLKIIFDGFNFAKDGLDQMEVMRTLYDRIVHVHMKNHLIKKGIPVPVHMGDIDVEEVFNFLIKRGYSGFVSLEYFNQDYDELIKESLKYMKRFLMGTVPNEDDPR